MDQIGKFIASAVVMFLFMFSLIFCFDSPHTDQYPFGQCKRAVLGRTPLAHQSERRQAMKRPLNKQGGSLVTDIEVKICLKYWILNKHYDGYRFF